MLSKGMLILIAGAVSIAVLFAAFVLWYMPGEQEGLRTIIVVRNPPALDDVWESFRARLADLGYRDGENILFIETDVSDDFTETKNRISPLLKREDVDLVFTMGISSTRAAKEVADALRIDTPVLFAVVSDPVGAGLVASMKRSGNNLTGVTPSNELVASKRLEFLKEMIPGVRRIVYAWNDEKTSGVDGLRRVAPSFSLDLVERRVDNVSEMLAYLGSFSYREGDALLRASDAIGAGGLHPLIDMALEKGIPLVGTNEGDVVRGALMSYGADYEEIGRQAARMADGILGGVVPADLPIEEATRFELSVNLDTATKIGVAVPRSFLMKAHNVIAEKD